MRVKLNLIPDLVKRQTRDRGRRFHRARHDLQGARQQLKEAGAKEVHVLVSCPPHMNPCVYGIDFPDRSKLMAANYSHRRNPQLSERRFAALSSHEGLVRATGLAEDFFCMACFDGEYPGRLRSQVDKHIMERRRARVESLGEALAKEELQPKLL